METVHVINLEKYQPGYKDRHHRWSKVYYDILLDPDFQQLHEIDRYRYLSLILYETFLMGKPLVLTPTNLAILGWNTKKRAISLSLQMLHTFVECVTYNSNECAVDKSRVEESRVEKSIKSDRNGFFDKFWKLYPKKVGKGKAEESFLKVNPSEELFAQILSAVARQKLSPDWNRENGRYIPHPATWLNQKRWGDEIDVEVALTKTKLPVLFGKTCGEKGCGLPAVYKSTGDYDNYYCTNHMPEKIKEKYE